MDNQPMPSVSQPAPSAKHPQAGLAAFTYLVFFAPNIAGKSSDQFVKYHQRQAVGLALFGLVLQGAVTIIGWWMSRLGFYSYGAYMLLIWLIRFVLIYLVIMGAKGAWEGKTEELPWIGKYATRLGLPS